MVPLNSFLHFFVCLRFPILLLIVACQHLYPDDVLWAEEGYLFSWQMKMRDKDGYADFTVTYMDTGEKLLVRNSDYLTRVQWNRLPQRAEYILGYAHFLCQNYGEQRPVQVHVDSQCTYNSRAFQPIVYPDVNLCEKRVNLFSSSVGDWIVPLTTPFTSTRADEQAKIVEDGVAAIMENGPEQYVKERVAKYFGADLFFGTVLSFDPGAKEGRWLIKFDDGEQKYFKIRELARRLHLYRSKRRLDFEGPMGGETCRSFHDEECKADL
jgi:hypothetical protein